MSTKTHHTRTPTELINEIAEGRDISALMAAPPVLQPAARRADTQEEVRLALSRHPGVHEVHVVLRDEADSRSGLVAAVVPYPRNAPTLGRHTRFELPNGLAIVCEDETRALSEYRTLFEQRVALQHGLTLGPDDCVVDISAGIGMFALFVRRLHPQIRVLAAERERETCERLRLNLALYEPDIPVVHADLASTAAEWQAFTARYGLSHIDLLRIDLGGLDPDWRAFEAIDLSGVRQCLIRLPGPTHGEIWRKRLMAQGYAARVERTSAEGAERCYLHARRPDDRPRQQERVTLRPVAIEPRLSVPELRSYLAAQVPDVAVAAIVILERLPTTPGGDIDDRALLAAAGAEGASTGPRTPIEGRIAEIWSTLLGFGGFGVDDDFFGLGGHSLLATQVLSRVNEEFEIEVPLTLLFDESITVRSLAHAVEDVLAQKEAEGQGMVALDASGADDGGSRS